MTTLEIGETEVVEPSAPTGPESTSGSVPDAAAPDPADTVPPRPAPPAWRHVRALSGVRAVAIGLIVLGVAAHGAGIGRGAWIGFEVFGVLSGFVITTTLTDEAARSRNGGFGLIRFYLRRVLRLWPALLACLAVITVYARVAHPGQSAATTHQVLATLTGWLNIYDLGHSVQPALAPLWALCLQEQFYVVWAVVLLLCLRAFTRRVALRVALTLAVLAALVSVVVAVVLTVRGASPVRLLEAPDTGAAALFIGSAFGLAHASGATQRWAGSRATRALPWIAGAVVLIWTLTARVTGSWQFAGTVQAVEVLVGAALVSLVLSPGRAATLLRRRTVVRAGAVSYSLYLWTGFAFAVAPASGAGTANHLVHYAVLVLLLVEVPVLSYVLIERRVRQLAVSTRRRVAPPASLSSSQAVLDDQNQDKGVDRDDDLLGFLLEIDGGDHDLLNPTTVEA